MESCVEVLAVILFGILVSRTSCTSGPAGVLSSSCAARESRFVDWFLNLPLGALNVGFHNIWSGIPLALALVGWGPQWSTLRRYG